MVSHPRPSLIARQEHSKIETIKRPMETDGFVIVASERAKGIESKVRNPSQTSVLSYLKANVFQLGRLKDGGRISASR